MKKENNTTHLPFIIYCRLMIYTKGKSILINFLLGTVAYILLAISITAVFLSSRSGAPKGLLEMLFSTYTTAFLFLSLFNTSDAFSLIHSRWNISLYHALPVSQWNKFLAALLLFLICQGIFFLFFTLVTHSLMALVFSFQNSVELQLLFKTNIYIPAYFAEFADPASRILNPLLFLFFHSVFFLGAVVFKSRHFTKTILAALGIGTIVGLLFTLILLSNNNNYIYFDNTILQISLLCLGNVLCIALSYLRIYKHDFSKVKS